METKGFRSIAVAVLLSVLIVVSSPMASAITCGQVAAGVSGCINYARNGGFLPPGCCAGLRGLNSAARTTPDRQQVCTCLKRVLPSISGVNMNLVSGIPGRCGINVGYPISLSIDCSKVA